MKIYTLLILSSLLLSCSKKSISSSENVGTDTEDSTSASPEITTKRPKQPLVSSISKSYDVEVVDKQGKPIEAASVMPVTLSTSGKDRKTNSNGGVKLGWSIQDIEWVTVSKEGYHTVVQQQYKGKSKPVRVVLSKSDK